MTVENVPECLSVSVSTVRRVVVPANGPSGTRSRFLACGVPAAGCPDQGPARIQYEFDFVGMFGEKCLVVGLVPTCSEFQLQEIFLDLVSWMILSTGQHTKWTVAGVVSVQRGADRYLLYIGSSVHVPGYLASTIYRFPF